MYKYIIYKHIYENVCNTWIIRAFKGRKKN